MTQPAAFSLYLKSTFFPITYPSPSWVIISKADVPNIDLSQEMFRQYSKANIPHTFLWAAETRVGLSRREEVEKSPLGREQRWGKESDGGFIQDLDRGGRGLNLEQKAEPGVSGETARMGRKTTGGTAAQGGREMQTRSGMASSTSSGSGAEGAPPAHSPRLRQQGGRRPSWGAEVVTGNLLETSV